MTKVKCATMINMQMLADTVTTRRCLWECISPPSEMIYLNITIIKCRSFQKRHHHSCRLCMTWRWWWVIMYTYRTTDRTTNLLISSNVHFVHLGRDKYRNNWPRDNDDKWLIMTHSWLGGPIVRHWTHDREIAGLTTSRIVMKCLQLKWATVWG